MMPLTEAAIKTHLPRDLAILALDYLGRGNGSPYYAAYNGLGELCVRYIKDGPNAMLRGAAVGGHLELVDYLLRNGATDLDGGLAAACASRNIQAITYMFTRGATFCRHCGQGEETHL